MYCAAIHHARIPVPGSALEGSADRVKHHPMRRRERIYVALKGSYRVPHTGPGLAALGRGYITPPLRGSKLRRRARCTWPGHTTSPLRGSKPMNDGDRDDTAPERSIQFHALNSAPEGR